MELPLSLNCEIWIQLTFLNLIVRVHCVSIDLYRYSDPNNGKTSPRNGVGLIHFFIAIGLILKNVW